jgi:regulator of replication initiation timing
MSKSAVYQQELAKLTEIFKDVEDSKRQLVEGLVEDAAFLKAENYALKQNLSETGMVNIHPQYPQLQKPFEAAKQYLKNVNSYSVIIKTLNGVLNKNILEDEDELSDYE